MMKKIGFLFPCFLLSVLLQAQQLFWINGHLTAIKDAELILAYSVNKELLKDTVQARDGVFAFSGNISGPVKAMLVVKPDQADTLTKDPLPAIPDYCYLFIDAGETTVEGTKAETALVKGGPSESDLNSLEWGLRPFNEDIKRLNRKYRKKAKEFASLSEADRTAKKQQYLDSVEQISDQMNTVNEKMKAVEESFIRTHPSSEVSWDLVKKKDHTYQPGYLRTLVYGA